MPLIILIAIGLWFWFGDPPKTMANWFWESDAAPWETVDAFYYPNRNDLTQFQKMPGLNSVDECRSWVRSTASINGDSGIMRGDYECAIEVVYSFAGISVYRTTTR